MKNEAYVFDTSALLAYIENEDGADIIENIILQVLNSEKDSIYISTVSMIETYYISIQEQGIKIAEERLRLIETLPFIQVSLTPNCTKIIGELKSAKSML
jgi:PIN domain.